ncbi:L-serine ammonia-lyase [Draconibacterium sp. IB214405]|uniref:L-serine ammonia-lyase n=1 Tax=Draconibacterium sp. IB214405 TaxID=3097352 RepID=UPI002A1120F8|nr:L-serine ammonia-lyase [Draconibacterium sp. IB214405]MDX8339691.1 L-serine ammonia-lyase [Draconibacterium sp. IB214405]
MESIKEIYKIGHGPSSSHTMGPKKAAEKFLAENKTAVNFEVTLYGSLAATGKGHLTDFAIEQSFGDRPLQIVWEPKTFLPRHPNGMTFKAFNNQNELLKEWTCYSVGGGTIVDDYTKSETVEVYEHTTMAEILNWCNQNGKSFSEYVAEFEEPDVWDYLEEVWKVMSESIKRGLKAEGVLPGGLKLPRKAQSFNTKGHNFATPFKRRSQLFSYALAVMEENAAGGKIVAAPTCGASGVLPAVLKYFTKIHKSDKRTILRALATAGIIGNLVKTNASISGAEVGCQGEVGTACAMASGAATQMMGGTIYQIEYSAEMGLEHHLGLTCDPVAGLVQIPCIERNAFAAERAVSHNNYALLTDGRHRISFDEVVETMYKTGIDLQSKYRETSEGGLAIFDALPNC